MDSPLRSPLRALSLQVEDPALPPSAALGAPMAFDDDVAALAVKMDDYAAYVKSGLTDFFADIKKKLNDEKEEAVDLERRIAANRLATKQVRHCCISPVAVSMSRAVQTMPLGS